MIYSVTSILVVWDFLWLATSFGWLWNWAFIFQLVLVGYGIVSSTSWCLKIRHFVTEKLKSHVVVWDARYRSGASLTQEMCFVPPWSLHYNCCHTWLIAQFSPYRFLSTGIRFVIHLRWYGKIVLVILSAYYARPGSFWDLSRVQKLRVFFCLWEPMVLSAPVVHGSFFLYDFSALLDSSF